MSCGGDFVDSKAVLNHWATAGPDSDLDQTGAVDFNDLNIVLLNWGAACTP